jgi:hypothetical protein
MQLMILVMKEPSNYLKHSNQIHLSLHSILKVTSCFFSSFSLIAENQIDLVGLVKLSEALKTNTCITSLNLAGNKFIASFDSHYNTDNKIGYDIDNVLTKKFAKAIKSNTCITSLDFEGANLLLLHFIHSKQGIKFNLKELSY